LPRELFWQVNDMAEAIVLSPDLREILESTAEREARSLNDIVNEAVWLYVDRLQRRKIDREADAYERMHDELRERYFGEWVAVHDGQLVDHDSDSQALYRRIRDKFGRTAVLLTRVSEKPVQDIWMRTRSTGKLPS
jgi:predicted DNA-binding protein